MIKSRDCVLFFADNRVSVEIPNFGIVTLFLMLARSGMVSALAAKRAVILKFTHS